MSNRIHIRIGVGDQAVVVNPGQTTAVGRQPPPDGIVIGADDATVSAVAMTVTAATAGVTIHNTSRFSELEVGGPGGRRLLFPGEALQLAQSTTVIVPGANHMYRVRIECEGAAPAPAPAGGTQPMRGHDSSVADERRDALTALCLARFQPERFGVDLLNATEIADLLSRRGRPSTAKAVNNKLQRLREQLAARHGVYLESREDLADFAIRHGLVTPVDVEHLLGPP